jgi:hypothetical protein
MNGAKRMSKMDNEEAIIKNGRLFSECTPEQLEWAKTQDEMTDYYIKIWANPKENAMQLCDPMWYNGKWVDFVW